jgi:hypothetical protein
MSCWFSTTPGHQCLEALRARDPRPNRRGRACGLGLDPSVNIQTANAGLTASWRSGAGVPSRSSGYAARLVTTSGVVGTCVPGADLVLGTVGGGTVVVAVPVGTVVVGTDVGRDEAVVYVSPTKGMRNGSGVVAYCGRPIVNRCHAVQIRPVHWDERVILTLRGQRDLAAVSRQRRAPQGSAGLILRRHLGPPAWRWSTPRAPASSLASSTTRPAVGGHHGASLPLALR